MSTLVNYTFDEIEIGQRAEFTRSVSDMDLQLFASVSGDVNPLHLDETFAATTAFGKRIAHGMLSGAFISAALAMRLPGPGTVYLNQQLQFRKPVYIGDEITVVLEVSEKNARRKRVTLSCEALNQHGVSVLTGTAEVIAPAEKLCLQEPNLPRFSVQK